MQCSICQGPIDPQGPNGEWTQGHNAQPVNDGRCCTQCNDAVVIPMRLRRIFATQKRKRSEVT